MMVLFIAHLAFDILGGLISMISSIEEQQSPFTLDLIWNSAGLP